MSRNSVFCNSVFYSMRGFFALLATACLLATCSPAMAQRSGGKVYNPVTQRSELNQQQLPSHRRASPRQAPSRPVATTNRTTNQPKQRVDSSNFATQASGEFGSHGEAGYGEAGYGGCDSCGDDACGGCVGCGDVCCGDSVGCGNSFAGQFCSPSTRLYAGFEATYVKPHFGNNVAFTVREGDGSSNESFSDTQFDYDLKFTPRVFLGWEYQNGIGLRATWWSYDHGANTTSASPNANGFGRIDPAPFEGIDISTTIPTDTISATTDLVAYSIDLEVTKKVSFCNWDLGVAGGVRYAYTEQSYFSELRNTNNALRGQINYTHSLEGFGPTISLDAFRPLNSQMGVFCKARGSLLYGDGQSSLAAGENLDLTSSFNTTRVSSRSDLLPIGEIQVGLRWQARECRSQPYRPFFTLALEGQVWNGAGSAASEEGDLGFFGFNTGFGLDW